MPYIRPTLVQCQRAIPINLSVCKTLAKNNDSLSMKSIVGSLFLNNVDHYLFHLHIILAEPEALLLTFISRYISSCSSPLSHLPYVCLSSLPLLSQRGKIPPHISFWPIFIRVSNLSLFDSKVLPTALHHCFSFSTSSNSSWSIATIVTCYGYVDFPSLSKSFLL